MGELLFWYKCYSSLKNFINRALLVEIYFKVSKENTKIDFILILQNNSTKKYSGESRNNPKYKPCRISEFTNLYL